VRNQAPFRESSSDGRERRAEVGLERNAVSLNPARVNGKGWSYDGEIGEGGVGGGRRCPQNPLFDAVLCSDTVT